MNAFRQIRLRCAGFERCDSCSISDSPIALAEAEEKDPSSGAKELIDPSSEAEELKDWIMIQ